jgi:EmrB/QacA subfamily drug resistance transporter
VSQTGTIAQARPARTRHGGAGGVRGNPALTLLAVALGVIMVALDGTVVAVANPTIQAQLHASLADIQWVTNGYLLALAVTLITIGKFGDRFGHRNVFLIGIIGFGATSAAVGLSGDIAHSIGLIIAFRAAQGVFGAMLQPTALALIRNAFPAERLSGALGIWGGAVGASTAAGPIVGGLLVQHINWESIFYINVPVGVIALVMGLIVLRETPSRAAGSFDVPGILLLSAALFLLIWGLIKGSSYGWASGRTLAFLGGAVLAGALFVFCESRTREPLLPLRLFRSVPLSAGTVLVLTLMFALFGAMFFTTFYLENVRGLDAVATGVRLLPMTGMMIVGSPLAGALISKAGPRIPMVAGMLMGAAGLFGLSRVGVASSLNDTIGWFVLLGLGLSPVIVGATDVIVGNAPRELAGVAGGLQSTAMQLGGTLGTAILGAVMSARVSSLLPARWAAAHLPHLTASQLTQLKSAVTVGVAPVPPGTPPQLAALLTNVSHTTFVGGMNTAFLVAAVVAIAGAAIGLLARQGQPTAGEAAVAATVDEAANGHTWAAHATNGAAIGGHRAVAGQGSPADDGGLAGVVRGSGGTPLGGVAVTIIDSSGAQVAHEVTAGDGRYSIHGVRPGVYTALVTASHHRPLASMVTLNGPWTPGEFTVTGTGVVYGVVRRIHRGEHPGRPGDRSPDLPDRTPPNGAGGTALDSASVILSDTDGTIVAQTVTEPNGSYRFSEIPEGDYTVTARTPLYQPAATAATIIPGAQVRADLILTGTAALAGVVRQAAGGAPLAGASVTLAGPTGQIVAQTITGPDGRYLFTDLPEGTYTVVASGFHPVATPLTLTAGQRLDLDLTLGQGWDRPTSGGAER